MFDPAFLQFVGEEFLVCAFLTLRALEVFFPSGTFGDRKLADALSVEWKRGWVRADDGALSVQRGKESQQDQE